MANTSYGNNGISKRNKQTLSTGSGGALAILSLSTYRILKVLAAAWKT